MSIRRHERSNESHNRQRVGLGTTRLCRNGPGLAGTSSCGRAGSHISITAGVRASDAVTQCARGAASLARSRPRPEQSSVRCRPAVRSVCRSLRICRAAGESEPAYLTLSGHWPAGCSPESWRLRAGRAGLLAGDIRRQPGRRECEDGTPRTVIARPRARPVPADRIFRTSALEETNRPSSVDAHLVSTIGYQGFLSRSGLSLAVRA